MEMERDGERDGELAMCMNFNNNNCHIYMEEHMAERAKETIF